MVTYKKHILLYRFRVILAINYAKKVIEKIYEMFV